QHEVRVRPGEAALGQPVQLVLQLVGDQRTGTDAVDVDPLGRGDRIDDPGQRGEVELTGGVLDRSGVGEGDLVDDGGYVVVELDGPAVHLVDPGLHAGRVGGERDAQLRVAADPDGLAEAGHGRFARACCQCHFGDAAGRDRGRVLQHDL